MPAASAAPTEGSQVPHFCHPLAEVGLLNLLLLLLFHPPNISAARSALAPEER
jgi:hypothetical protein